MSRRWIATSPVSPAGTTLASSSMTATRWPGIRPPHAAGACGPFLMRVADDVIHLGLAEHFIDRDAKRVATPIEHRFADRLSGAHQRTQLQPIRCARFGNRFHHHLQRGRKQERIGHAVPLHQLERALRHQSGRESRRSEIRNTSSAAVHPSARRSTPNRQVTRTRRPVAETSCARRRSRAGCRSARDAASARPSAGRWCHWCRSAAPDHRPAWRTGE